MGYPSYPSSEKANGNVPTSQTNPETGPFAACQPSRLRNGPAIVVGILVMVFSLSMCSLVVYSRGTPEAQDGAMFLVGKSGSSLLSGGDLVSLRRTVNELEKRIKAIEAEHDTVVTENEKLRLDNKVEQSNLKSMTKSKNDEIRGISQRLRNLEKGAEADCGAVVGDLHKEREKLEGELKDSRTRLTMLENVYMQKTAAPVADLIASINPELEKTIMELFYLSKHDVNKFFERLEKEDPLGVSLDHPSAFHCPANASRLTLPDLRDASRLESFRKGRGVVFFQHLRKAGGTAFCDLATRNMPGEAPQYFCMPDRRGSLLTPPFKHQWLKVTRENGYRIAANEWDALTRATLDIPDLVLATTLRDPMDRWYSQYRFEHLEQRDESKKHFEFPKWYRSQITLNMGDNYYVKTFIGTENQPDKEALKKRGPHGVPIIHGDFYWTYLKFRNKEITWAMFRQALDTLLRFQIVLVLEWLRDSDRLVEKALGWTEKPRQVLPHDHGKRGKDKKSKRARDLVAPAEYIELRNRNAMDYLFYHVGRRIYLEHYNCGGF